MWGRFYAVAVAVLFVLPIVLIFDTALRPNAAWSRVGRSKWRWVAAFAFAPIASALSRSFLPAVAIAPVSFFYMAHVRSVLDVSTGLSLVERGRPLLTAKQQDALAPLVLTGPPIVLFLGIILWTGDTRGRVIATAIALGGLAAVGGVCWRNLRRL